ncbi:hypothetical protein [Enterobacter cloacae complex sp. ESBL7]|uniref:hypothetical protein n=1 Tax=Enterobacter cloacae complex sp. ESBL7 TaxID=3163325 RepID=UPI0035642A64
MTQKMTDDAKRILGAFREAPVMTLQAVSTIAGLGEHTTRFILEQLRQAGWVLERHKRWSIAGGHLSDDQESSERYVPERRYE